MNMKIIVCVGSLVLLGAVSACTMTDGGTSGRPGNAKEPRESLADADGVNRDPKRGSDGESETNENGGGPTGEPETKQDGGSTPPVEISGWKLVFQDEFDGDTLDKRWEVYGGPQANAPDTSKFDPAQVSVSGGQLHLKIEKRTVDGRPYACGGLELAHDLAMPSGRWVARARFPQGHGYVGYIGLFGPGEGQDYAEIDFAEVAGKDPMINTFTQHFGLDGQDAHRWTKADSTTDFHEYTLIWEDNQFTWLVDGVEEYRTSQKIGTKGMGIAMGDWASNQENPWFGWPNETTPPVSNMDVDYVRIYKR